MMLENYLTEDLGKTNITLLAGEIKLLSPGNKENITLVINQPVHINVGMHQVRRVGYKPVS